MSVFASSTVTRTHIIKQKPFAKSGGRCMNCCVCGATTRVLTKLGHATVTNTEQYSLIDAHLHICTCCSKIYSKETYSTVTSFLLRFLSYDVKRYGIKKLLKTIPL